MKLDGMKSAAQALRYWEHRQQVMAHNLANVSTPGYKGERAFGVLLQDRTLALQTARDPRQGQLTPTGNPLDVALEGPGYLVVATDAGERLMRGGVLRLDAGGRLVDSAGNPVLGQLGEVVLPQGQISIDTAGNVSVDGRSMDSLRVEAVPPDVDLNREGASLYVPDPARAVVPPAERGIKQGFLEESNIDHVGSLVDMLTVQRAFAAVQKTVHVLDGVMDTVVNDLGRPV